MVRLGRVAGVKFVKPAIKHFSDNFLPLIILLIIVRGAAESGLLHNGFDRH